MHQSLGERCQLTPSCMGMQDFEFFRFRVHLNVLFSCFILSCELLQEILTTREGAGEDEMSSRKE